MLFSASGYGYDYDSASFVRDDKNKSCAGCVRYESEYKSTDHRLYVVLMHSYPPDIFGQTGALFSPGRAAFPGHRHSPQHRPRPRPKTARDKWGAEHRCPNSRPELMNALLHHTSAHRLISEISPLGHALHRLAKTLKGCLQSKAITSGGFFKSKFPFIIE